MIISYFHSSLDNDPAHSEVTWDQLAEGLKHVRSSECTLETCKRSDCPHKDGPSWSTARYIEGKKRGVSNVIDVHALIVDLDHVSPDDLPVMLGNVERYRKIITSSHSDRELDRCLRVVLALSRPVLASEWYRFWGIAIKVLGLAADKQVKDPSRLYYLPSRSKDACHPAFDGTGFAYEASDGDVLDVDAFLELAPEEVPDIDEDYEVPDFNGAPSARNLEIAVTALAGAWPDKGRNTCQLALAGALARAGWPVDLITDFLEAVCELATPGNGDRAKRLKSARASVSKVQAGELVAGWPTVEEYVDPEVVKMAMDALGMGGPRFDQDFVNAFSNLVQKDEHLVDDNVSRDDVHTALLATKKRLGRASVDWKIAEAKILGRVLSGESLTTHAEDDAQAALIKAVRVLKKHAPKGTRPIILAEFLLKSRPDLNVDEVCTLFENANRPDPTDRNNLPEADWDIEISGPRMGKPIASSQKNFDIALEQLKVTFHYNKFSRKRLVERPDSIEVVEDRQLNGLMFEIERLFNFYPPKDKWHDYCKDKAYANEFHPVLDYFASLPTWDGVNRTETWLIDCGGAKDTPFVRAVSRIILVAAVRRIKEPGCKFDEMLILESPQGIGKSTAIKTLCPNTEWFADNFHLDGDTKKMMEQTAGKWIVESGELKGMSSRDHNALKAYLSSAVDEARMAFEREIKHVPRQFIIIGSTNDLQYLKDHTGDRRYWPVKTPVFDVALLASIRDQLWAEACILEAQGVSIRLDPSLYEAAREEQALRKVDNAIKITLEEHLDGLEGILKVSDTWKIIGEDLPSQAIMAQVSAAMSELGWKRERAMVGGKRTYFYIKGNSNIPLAVSGNVAFGITIKPITAEAAN